MYSFEDINVKHVKMKLILLILGVAEVGDDFVGVLYVNVGGD